MKNTGILHISIVAADNVPQTILAKYSRRSCAHKQGMDCSLRVRDMLAAEIFLMLAPGRKCFNKRGEKMIISASRRTDIPTYYSEWFMNRIREGFVYVRNPMNIHRISQIALAPEVVDGIVFWTKNPIPMLPKLDELKAYMYCFQFTLNAYGKDIEANVPGKNDIIIPAFRELSNKIGAERVIWRYDPILLTPKYTIDYHVKYFEEIAKRLSGYTHKCVISFLDLYRNTKANMKGFDLLPLEEKEMYALASRIADTAQKYHLAVESCAERVDLAQYGIAHGHCIDRNLFERLLGRKLDLSKDPNQREECGCMTSIDIGMYNTCKNGCVYCYANDGGNTVAHNFNAHDPCSPLISGAVGDDDKISIRKVKSCKRCQIGLFD